MSMKLVVLLALTQMISSYAKSEQVRPLQLAPNNSPLLLKVILSLSNTRLATPRHRHIARGPLSHDSFLVRVEGSNNVTKRNRQFIWKIEPYIADTDLSQLPVWASPQPNRSNYGLNGTADRDPDIAMATPESAPELLRPSCSCPATSSSLH